MIDIQKQVDYWRNGAIEDWQVAELAGLSLAHNQIDIMAEMNAFNLEGRYPDPLTPTPSLVEAKDFLRRAEEVYQWLMSQL